MKVVKVLWVDSCNSNMNWTVTEDIEVELMYIDSFGVVVKDTDEFLAIAQNYGDNPEQYSNITTIPKGCIKEVFVIHEDNVCENEQKPAFEMITPEESLGIDSDTYNKIVDECIYGEQTPADKIEPKFKIGDYVKNVNDKREPIYEIVYMDKECYICEYRGKERMGDKAVMHFAFDNPYLRLVEPKFKVGDFLVNDYCMGRVVELTDDAYLLDTEQGIPFSCEHNVHLWTIQDAKDGDVLATDNSVCIFDGTLEEGKYPFAYCGLTKQRGFESYNENLPFSHDNNIHPATKEQRDLLFSKINEAGYEWDTEKKELKEIIDENQIKKNLQDNSFRRMFEQKPICNEEQHEKESLSEIENRIINFAMQFHDNRMKPEAEWEDELKMLRDNIKLDTWSEEDESILSHIINNLKFLKDTISIDPNYFVNITDIEREINWFKSFKDRIQPQTKQEWSEKDELMLEESIGFIKSSPYPYAGDTLRGEISKTEAEDWLKSLKYRVQPQQEWSKEEQQIIEDAACLILSCVNTAETKQEEERLEKLADKLQDLRPQSTWKPSFEH